MNYPLKTYTATLTITFNVSITSQQLSFLLMGFARGLFFHASSLMPMDIGKVLFCCLCPWGAG